MKNGGVVAAGDRQTAEAGAEILRAGGNAVDAILGATAASFVVEVPLGSPAGGGALLVRNQNETRLLDFFTRVPGQGLGPARPDELDFHAVSVDYGPTSQDFHVGRGSAAIPTCIYGLLEAHARYGSMPLREVFAPAIQLARDGYVLSHHLHWVFRLLSPILTLTDTVRPLHCQGDAIAPSGARMRNQGLGDFLEAVATQGRDFLDTDFAAAVHGAFGPHAGGRITLEDLRSYTPSWRDPLAVRLYGHTLLTNSPPSSGGTLIALSLRLAEHLDVARHRFGSAEHLTAVARVLAAVSAARADGFDEAISRPDAAHHFLSDEAVHRYALGALPPAAEPGLGHTTHLSVVDAEGNAASLTMSNGEGCGHALPQFGIHMNNFLGEEDINPGGFHKLPVGAKMTTMMSPSMVLDGGRPAVVLGSGGANRIRSAIFQALLNHLAFGLDLDASVNAGRLHVEGSQLWFEDLGWESGAADALAAQWPGVARFDDHNMFFGGVNAAGIGAGGARIGGADQRRGGALAYAHPLW